MGSVRRGKSAGWKARASQGEQDERQGTREEKNWKREKKSLGGGKIEEEERS